MGRRGRYRRISMLPRNRQRTQAEIDAAKRSGRLRHSRIRWEQQEGAAVSPEH